MKLYNVLLIGKQEACCVQMSLALEKEFVDQSTFGSLKINEMKIDYCPFCGEEIEEPDDSLE